MKSLGTGWWLLVCWYGNFANTLGLDHLLHGSNSETHFDEESLAENELKIHGKNRLVNATSRFTSWMCAYSRNSMGLGRVEFNTGAEEDWTRCGYFRYIYLVTLMVTPSCLSWNNTRICRVYGRNGETTKASTDCDPGLPSLLHDPDTPPHSHPRAYVLWPSHRPTSSLSPATAPPAYASQTVTSSTPTPTLTPSRPPLRLSSTSSSSSLHQ